MKKTYSLIATAFISVHLNAQITLTSENHTPQVGDVLHYVLNPFFTFNVSQSGPDQTWDFSSAAGMSMEVNYVDVASSSDPSAFPIANIVELNVTASGVIAESYYRSTPSELTFEGQVVPNSVKLIYTDDRELVKFPITYGETFYETFSGTIENIAAGQTLDRSGTVEITADGYGDLILPYTTVSNVLRVKAIYNYDDHFLGTPVLSYTDTICMWYNATNRQFIATTSVIYAGGMEYTSQATYIKQADFVSGMNDLDAAHNSVSFYPNPATDHIIIKNETNEMFSVHIYDIRSVLVKTVPIHKENKPVNVSDLDPGIYFIKYTKESNCYTDKLVIK